MNMMSSSLTSDSGRRRLLASASSGGSAGLDIYDIIKSGLVGQNPIRSGQATAAGSDIQESVFQALAAAKIWTSRVAMHMDRVSRDRYFRQLDLLHDCEEWFEGEKPLTLDSYKGFVRFMLLIGGRSKPSLALSPKGRLLAVWQSGPDRLTIEFTSGDSAEWVVSHRIEDRTERAAGSTSIARLVANLAPYGSDAWFGVV
jgi:hypothetical protein